MTKNTHIASKKAGTICVFYIFFKCKILFFSLKKNYNYFRLYLKNLHKRGERHEIR